MEAFYLEKKLKENYDTAPDYRKRIYEFMRKKQ